MSQSTVQNTKLTEVNVSIFTKCEQCALWLTKPDDSTPCEFGTCPRRYYPLNRTHAEDGCYDGVLPKD